MTEDWVFVGLWFPQDGGEEILHAAFHTGTPNLRPEDALNGVVVRAEIGDHKVVRATLQRVLSGLKGEK